MGATGLVFMTVVHFEHPRFDFVDRRMLLRQILAPKLARFGGLAQPGRDTTPPCAKPNVCAFRI